MRKQRLKLFVIVFAILIGGFMITWNHEFLSDQMKAASDYTTGNKVYIGNDSYTIIDPATMTLLKDSATDDGEMTWDDAVASLNNLPSNYGQLGSKLVSGHFSLPKSTDLTLITNNDTLTTIDPIGSDWWLGDDSVDNRSKFVGANTNSLVTDVTIIKNILDTVNHVCNVDQTVTEQGVKPTNTGNDPDAEPDTVQVDSFTVNFILPEGTLGKYRVNCYSDEKCGNSYGTSTSLVGTYLQFDSTWGWKTAMDAKVLRAVEMNMIQKALVDLGMLDYLKKYSADNSKGYDQQFKVSTKLNTCQKSGEYAPLYDSNRRVKSYTISKIDAPSKTDETFSVQVRSVAKKLVPLECKGHAQTAGESGVRPLLTLDKSKIAYSSVSKPSFNTGSLINQTVPEVNGNAPYLTMIDPDLGIALDSGNPSVSGTTLSVDRSNSPITIPVTLSGTTSGDRYVSAIATTSSGEQYGVLGLVSGTSGNVQLDVSNLPSGKVNVTLYQEVDEGTNTTYRGNGTAITLDMSAPITAITFTPKYPSGKTSWNIGDSGIDTAGAQTGTFTFTGGSSGKIDPTSGKDYQKWEIVDASGNVTTDANFRISNNELIAKKRITAGSYTLYVKVTDNNNQTFTDSITITVNKASNPFDWNNTVKNTSSLYYGDTLTLGVIGVQESAAVSYGPTTHVSGNTFTAKEPIANIDITASTTATASYGVTAITHSVSIQKRPLAVRVQLKDSSGQWNNHVTIQQGQALPDHQVIIDNSSSNNQGLATGDSLSDAKLGNVTYEYRQGSTVVSNPASQPGTYQLYAVYGNSNYYTISVKAATLVVASPITIDNTNKNQFYEFRLANGNIADITKWQKENIMIHPKHSDYNKMKVDNGSYQSGDFTYTQEGINTVTLSFQNNSGATTSSINETLKIDKTNPNISKVEFIENGSVKSESSGVFQYLFQSNADIRISANDNESGIARYLIKITPLKNDGTIDTDKQVINQNTPSASSTFTYSLPNQGCYMVEVSVEDRSGRSTSYASKKIKISNQQITLNVKGYLNNDPSKSYDETKWTNQAITLQISASDGSALTNQQISFDNASWQAMPNGIYTVANTHSINNQIYYMKATNVNGDEISTSMNIKLDVDKPNNLKISYADVSQSGIRSLLRAITFNQLFNQEQNATFSANDVPSGIDHYEYTIQEKDNNGNHVGTAIRGKGTTYRLSKDKNYEIQVIAYDKAGNASQPLSELVQIDTTPPTISGVKDNSEYKQYYLPRFVSVKDTISGVKNAYYVQDGNAPTPINRDVRIVGTGSYTIYAEDNAGNEITISFKIVPLPAIDDIDGSDESKDIIDQVIDELEEIKDKIDETEKEDIEDWIRDALEKWNACRKKIVYTDDKSAKVEGQGDTSFDPRVELIVDEISENDIPRLPRKALVVYDVYLRKGTIKIQPDGSIKVYLPYTEELASLGEAMGGVSAEPIVYQIDTNNKVTQIRVQREGNFVTFITDKLYKYAISNEAQEENKSECKLNGIKINIDTDNDGYPDINVDIDNDCVADLNIDMDDDRIPDINIDSDGDGKAEINIDTDDDGKANLNIAFLQQWIPEKVVTINGFTYDTMTGIQPYLNIDDDGDGKPDRNIDANGNGIIDDEENGNKNIGGATDSVNTGDHTKWFLWWILVVLTAMIMVYSLYQKRKESK